MKILAIETSCDETALAIVKTDEPVGGLQGETFQSQGLTSKTFNTLRVLAENTLSQIALHKEYGGVFPMMAKREHARTLVPLLLKTLKDAGLYKRTSRHVIESPLRQDFQEILDHEPELFAQFINEIPYIDPPSFDAIAVTRGPGLEPALWVGINFAKALSLIWKIPVIPVNHMEGHILSALLEMSGEDSIKYQVSSIEFPVLALLVSGGHTELVLMRAWGNYEIIGETKDDAAGEAFDKVARMLGLPYPGGPYVSALAEISRNNADRTPKDAEANLDKIRRKSASSLRESALRLPRPMLHSPDYNFSFAGLKTAVLYLIKKLGKLTDKDRADIAREFEEACVEVLVTKTVSAAKEFDVKTIVMGGGVSANVRLQRTLKEKVAEKLSSVTLYVPKPSLTTDNALMIALAGALHIDHATTEISSIRADGNWRLDQKKSIMPQRESGE